MCYTHVYTEINKLSSGTYLHPHMASSQPVNTISEGDQVWYSKSAVTIERKNIYII